MTADLNNNGVMPQMDITDIPLPDGEFDSIYCSHVLEHVSNDHEAISELFRVLKDGGGAIINVPITVENTFEDPSVTDPNERIRLFGQSDHVRGYGPDYIDRLRRAGFQVESVNPQDLTESDEARKLGLSNTATGCVLFCCK